MFIEIKNIFLRKKSKIVYFFILSLIISISSILSTYIYGKYIDYLAKNYTFEKVLFLIILYFLFKSFNIIISWVTSVIGLKIKSMISFDIISYFIDRLNKVSLKNLNRFESVYLSQRINTDSNKITEFILGDVYQVVLSIINLLITCIILINIDIKISFILILSLFTYFYLYKNFKDKINKHSYKYFESQNKYGCYLNEPFKFSKYIKINSYQNIFKCRINEGFNSFLDSLMDYGKISYLYDSLDDIISILFSSLVMIICCIEFLNGRISLGDITITLSYLSMIFSDVAYMLTFGKSFQESKASYMRLLELFNLTPENIGVKRLKSIDNIIFKGIDYHEGDSVVINNLDYEFSKGNIYVIHGKNGSGKSTLLYLISNIIKSTNGKILFNNKNINNLDMEYIRKYKISFLEQEPTLINDTFYNNMTLDLEEVSSINKYINMFDLSECFEKFHKNIDEVLTNNLENISGGEKQKISLVRALLKNADVLILDEPTSALDEKSSSRLKFYLNEIKNDKIIIIVTHSEDLKKIADFTIDVDAIFRKSQISV